MFWEMIRIWGWPEKRKKMFLEQKGCSRNTNVVLETKKQILVWEHNGRSRKTNTIIRIWGCFRTQEKKYQNQSKNKKTKIMIWECSGNTNKNICLGTQTHGTKDQNHMVWEHKHRYQCQGPFWEHKHRGWSRNKEKVWDTKTNIRIWGWFRTQNKIALKDEEQDLRTITKISRNNPSKEKLKLDLITDNHVLSLPWSRNDSR